MLEQDQNSFKSPINLLLCEGKSYFWLQKNKGHDIKKK